MAEAEGLLLLLLLVVRVTPLCSPACFIVLCHHVVYIVIFPSHVLAISGGSLSFSLSFHGLSPPLLFTVPASASASDISCSLSTIGSMQTCSPVKC